VDIGLTTADKFNDYLTDTKYEKMWLLSETSLLLVIMKQIINIIN